MLTLVLLALLASPADGIATDMAWIGLSTSADLYSTSWALRNCPECVEGNPFGPDSEARLALNLAVMSVTGYTCYRLRKDGHPGWARVVRWMVVGIHTAAVVNNVRRGR